MYDTQFMRVEISIKYIRDIRQLKIVDCEARVIGEAICCYKSLKNNSYFIFSSSSSSMNLSP